VDLEGAALQWRERGRVASGHVGGYTPANRLAFPSLVPPMSEVTRILSAIEQGDPSAAEQLLPLVYDELRQLAAQRLAHEQPGQTLQATALVHEAYLRLVDVEQAQHWNSRRHFFAACAEAMRRILVEHARTRGSLKRGGRHARIDLDDLTVATPERPDDLLALDEALSRLAALEPAAAELVHLRYFAGRTMSESADLLGLSRRGAHRLWAYARAWLLEELQRH
jgi:RNA polymerase sigma factor (TIGR02999 family)